MTKLLPTAESEPEKKGKLIYIYCFALFCAWMNIEQLLSFLHICILYNSISSNYFNNINCVLFLKGI